MVAFSSLPTQAATTEFEAVAGLNFSTVDYDGIDFRPGVHLGVRATWQMPDVTPGFYINAAGLLSFRGFKADSVSYSPCYLDIPVHAGYKYDMDGRIALFAEAGPYVGIGLFGKSEGRDVFSDEVGYKRIDLGLGMRAGIEFNNRITISVGGDFGFLRVTDDFSAKPRNLSISVGYKF